MKKLKKIYCSISLAFGTVTLLLALFLCFGQSAYATGANDQLTNERVQDTNTPNTERRDTSTDRTGLSFSLNNEEGNLSGNIRLLIGLTIISLAPAILIMLTSFTRIIVVLHFVRTAVGTQTVPPNQVMIGLALFLTLFIMNPVFSELNDTVVKPFDAGEISQEEALERAE